MKLKIIVCFLFLGLVLLAIVLCVNVTTQKPEILWESGISLSPTKIGNYEIDFVVISLSKRKETHFKQLESTLKKNDIQVAYFEAIDGKKIKYEDYNLAPRYIEFFENNRKERESGKTKIDYRGHLGCSISHLFTIRASRGAICIMEDDADLVPDFRDKLAITLNNLDKLDDKWECLVLGFSSMYIHHFYHKLNDHEPIINGIVKLHHWIGGWSYILRSKAVAEKVLGFFEPINWHIDLTLAEQTRLGILNTYAPIKTISLHPGSLRASSWDYTQVGNFSLYRSDTNN